MESSNSFLQKVYKRIFRLFPMRIAKKLGLDRERFCKMVVITKMLLSNVLGHAAELHYEKALTKNNITFKKAPTDEHYDYIVNNKKDQVKRWEVESTNQKYLPFHYRRVMFKP